MKSFLRFRDRSSGIDTLLPIKELTPGISKDVLVERKLVTDKVSFS